MERYEGVLVSLVMHNCGAEAWITDFTKTLPYKTIAKTPDELSLKQAAKRIIYVFIAL